MTLIAPLDIEQLFINVLCGGVLVFIGVAFVFLGTLAARFRMPNAIFAMMLALFGVFMFTYAGWLYITILIGVGLILGYILTRFQR